MTTNLYIVVADEFSTLRAELETIEDLFHDATDVIQEERNTIKALSIGRQRMVVKSFKRVGLLRGLIYRHLRKSKAQRSYEYAQKLVAMGFSTPKPVAYIEHRTPLGISDSYFVSLFLDHDFSIREALTKKIDDHERVIDEFVKFTYELHSAGILHLDHSPGNTLIKRASHGYQFSLVDINRLKFEEFALPARLDNLTRLTQDASTLKKIAYRYAELAGEPPEQCAKHLDKNTKKHFKKLAYRRRFKKWLKRTANGFFN